LKKITSLLSAPLFLLIACQQNAEQTASSKYELNPDELMDHMESPYARVNKIPINQIELTEGFWADKFNLVRDVTVPKMLEYMKTEMGSHYSNFLIAAGKQEGKRVGTPWHDGDFYKWLEAAVYVYHITGDPEMDRLMDEIISVIAEVQEPDGYISTFIQLTERERWQNKQHHELYNMGHLMTVSARHYEATGKTNLLRVGVKTADYLYNTFVIDRPVRLNPFGFNPSNVMGAMDIYRITGNKKYLALADTFLTMRGTTIPGETISWEESRKHTHPPGNDNNQDRVPFREETQVVGHAVTGTYLYAGAADIYMHTGEDKLLEVNENLWDDLTKHKLSVHGGVCPIDFGISVRRDPVHEAFSKAYELPNRRAYHETCANIGAAMWSWRLFQITGEAKYIDLMELEFYNAGISGLGLDGDSFFYTNVLRRYGQKMPGLLQSEHATRRKHLGSYCCPPQLARTVARMRQYFYGVGKDEPAIYVNFYGGSEMETVLSNNLHVQITQTTAYPWDGKVEIHITPETGNEKFSLCLRIPGWAESSSVKVNGERYTGELAAGSYFKLTRKWKPGDRVSLDFPMKIKLLRANPLVEDVRNQVAVKRGPVVYCLESTDLPKELSAMDIFLLKNAGYTAEYKPGLLGGITVINTIARHIHDEDWSEMPYDDDRLYKELKDISSQQIPIQLIPYHVWANRGPAEMTVWMPLAY